MNKETKLIEAAIEASKRAYAPYSKFFVGAALETSDGEIISGCNVENASYGLTNCAERTALFAAIAQGKRKFKRMALFVDHHEFIFPCGACRQVLIELAPKIELIVVKGDREVKKVKPTDLMPYSFTADQLDDR